MRLSQNIVVNADDLGLNDSVNKAILLCYKAGYINSSSILTNMAGFEQSVAMIHQNPCMINVGVHVNLAEGHPETAVDQNFLNDLGCWDLQKTAKLTNVFTKHHREVFMAEIRAQVNRVLSSNIKITHLDSHYHLHTLPCFYNLFIAVAQEFGLKLRLAQTFNEGNYLKYLYRHYINQKMIAKGINYSTYFETVDEFLLRKNNSKNGVTEIMLHPALDDTGKLSDHYDAGSMKKWLAFKAM